MLRALRTYGGTFVGLKQMLALHIPRLLRQYTQPPDIRSKVRTFLKNLIQSESQALSNSINLITADTEEDLHIHPSLQQDLNKVLDANNRLFLLLTYDPVLIDPRLYMSLYNKMDVQIDGNLRTLLLKRLLFAQEYTLCWQIVLDSYTSITDIEEFLDLALVAFNNTKDEVFGPYKLLAHCYFLENISRSVKDHVLETASVKYDIPRTRISSWLTYRLDTDAVHTTTDLLAMAPKIEEGGKDREGDIEKDNIEREVVGINNHGDKNNHDVVVGINNHGDKNNHDVVVGINNHDVVAGINNHGDKNNHDVVVGNKNNHDVVVGNKNNHDMVIDKNGVSDPIRQMIFLRRLLQVDPDYPSTNINSFISAASTISHIPGWLSLIAVPFLLSGCLLASGNAPELATMLVKTLGQFKKLRMSTADVVYAMRSGARLHPYLIYLVYVLQYAKRDGPNRYVLNHLVEEIIQKGNISQMRLIMVRSWSHLNEDLVILAMKILYANDPTSYKLLLEHPNEATIQRFVSDIEKELGGLGTIEQVREFFDACRKKNLHKCVRALAKVVAIPRFSNYDVIRFHTGLMEVKSKHILLESFRCLALRSKVLDQDSCTLFIERLLKLCLPLTILSRDQTRMPTFKHDIQKLMFLADQKERADFHNAIRAIGQCISLMDNVQMSKVLSMNYTAINKQQHIQSKYGKKYVWESIINETVRFVARSRSMKTSIMDLQNVKTGLPFECNVLELHILKLIVQEEPNNAQSLLKHFELRKHKLEPSIKYIISGIFSSSLSPANKIVYVDNFLTELAVKGYKHKVTQKTGYQLLRLLEKSKSASEPLASEVSRELAMKVMLSNKGLQRPVKKHLKRRKNHV